MYWNFVLGCSPPNLISLSYLPCFPHLVPCTFFLPKLLVLRCPFSGTNYVIDICCILERCNRCTHMCVHTHTRTHTKQHTSTTEPSCLRVSEYQEKTERMRSTGSVLLGWCLLEMTSNIYGTAITQLPTKDLNNDNTNGHAKME